MEPNQIRIEFKEPTGNARFRYTEIFDQMECRPDEWACIPLEMITGSTVAIKQNRMYAAARIRHLAIQTCVEDGQLYAKLRVVTNA
jgi:hypothetical protein